MEVTVNHLASVQFEILARHHTIASDQPVENCGFDEGMTPPELLLAALGSCAALLRLLLGELEDPAVNTDSARLRAAYRELTKCFSREQFERQQTVDRGAWRAEADLGEALYTRWAELAGKLN